MRPGSPPIPRPPTPGTGPLSFPGGMTPNRPAVPPGMPQQTPPYQVGYGRPPGMGPALDPYRPMMAGRPPAAPMSPMDGHMYQNRPANPGRGLDPRVMGALMQRY